MSPGFACPVCRTPETGAFMEVDGRRYRRCPTCEATFLQPDQRPDRDAEFAHYRRHDNRIDDPDYRRFLRRLADPLLARLAAASHGLDFGCGPGPALAAMLVEAGHTVALYDPFFAPDTRALESTYDFITCTEVVEHLHHPAGVFDRLDALLRPGGWLAVMTCFQTDDARFAHWHYRRDPTHVVFYREETLRRVADARGWSCDIPIKDVALMGKAGSAERVGEPQHP